MALSIDGQFFRVNGERWTGIASSEFSLPKRYLEGEDVRYLLDERAEIGFNELRLWLLNQSVVGQVYSEGIHPNQYPDFYERIRRFAELLASYGIVGEYTAFTSCNPLMLNVDDQQQHWISTCDALRGLPVKLELVNEYNWGHGENAPDRSLWDMRPDGLIASSGSSTADAPPPTPVWDYGLYHTNGLDQWQRKVGHNTMHDVADVYHVPGCANENTRYPDDEQSERHASDAAAGAALLCAGACYHSQSGKYSRPFDAVERRCAQAWVNGAKSVPLEFQAGRYVHRKDLESFKTCPVCHGSGCSNCDNTGKVPDPGTPQNPGIVRAYERVLSDGRAHLVFIRY